VQSPITVRGPMLAVIRAAWTAITAVSLLVWIVETPLLYRAALRLHNTNGMFTLRPDQWATGLHQLGLTPTDYAVLSMAGLYIMTASMFVVGLVIFLRRPHEWIALLVSYAFVNLGIGIVNAYAGGPALINEDPALATPLDIYMTLTVPSFYALFLIPLLFPDGRFVPRWTWVLIPGVVLDFIPVSVPGWISTPVQIVVFATVLLAPIYRYRRVSDPVQREQTKWVLSGLLLALGAFFALGLLQALIPSLTSTLARRVALALIGGNLVFLALSFLPIAFGIAILRYRLWEIDVLINRALVYGTLTVSLLALYIGGVIALQALFRAVTDQNSDLTVAVVTLAIAALFNPWRHRIQRFIDRRFYRHKYDASRTLAAFTSRLRDEVNVDQLKDSLLSVAHETMQPSSVALWLREAEGQGS
jgi:hypothetical protein